MKREITPELAKKVFAEENQQGNKVDDAIRELVFGLVPGTDAFFFAVSGTTVNAAKNELRALYSPLDDVKAGDGITVHYYSDAKAFTVLKRTDKSITLQRDQVTRLTKPEIEVGGFSGHCTNNREIKYSYEADPNGEVLVVRRNKNGFYKRPGSKGFSSDISKGRNEFYDYNF